MARRISRLSNKERKMNRHKLRKAEIIRPSQSNREMILTTFLLKNRNSMFSTGGKNLFHKSILVKMGRFCLKISKSTELKNFRK